MLADAIACPLTEKSYNKKKAFEEKVELYEKENRINFSCIDFRLLYLGDTVTTFNIAEKPEIKHFTAFFSVTGRPLGMQNDIKEIIADKIGADCEENWLVDNPRRGAQFVHCFGRISGFYSWRESITGGRCFDPD